MPLKPQRLKETRERKMLTQEELAARIGVSHRTAGRYEQGKTEPEAEILARLARVLDITIDYLMGLTDDAHHYMTGNDLSQDEGELVRAMRSDDPKVALDILYEKLSKEIKPKIVIPRRQPKSK